MVDFGQGTGHCRLSGIDHSPVTQYGTQQLFYDDQNRLIRVTNTGQGYPVTQFAYHDSVVIISYLDGSARPANIDSIVLNSRQQPLYEASGMKPDFYYENLFSYDDQGQLARIDTKQQGNVVASSTYSWKDGDMVQHNFGAGVVDYTYGDKPFQLGCQQQLSDFLRLGRSLWRPAHLLTSFKASTVAGTVRHFYSVDEEGKVISDSLYNTSGNSGYLTTFRYDCK
jgi:hypothetical protein